MTASPAEDALAAIEACLPNVGQASLHEPLFTGQEWSYVKDCLDSGWVSSVGPYVTRFEETLGKVVGAQAIATVNGTAALHICLILAGVRAGDEVVIPAMTFVATANAVAYCNAIPHFADSAHDTLGLDPQKLAIYLEDIAELQGDTVINRLTGRPIRALVAMHCFGHPVDLDPLADLCRRFNLVLIEDAAGALGSRYKGKHVGSVGRLGALSFNGNKTITTGGGGAILTVDPELARQAKHLTTTARSGSGWEYAHDAIGYNYRMPNINAALGCAQLEALPRFLAAKRELAERYRAAFSPLKQVRFVGEPVFAHSNYWLNTIAFETNAERERFLELANARGFLSRPPWRLMPDLPMFADSPSMDLASARSMAATFANVPSGPGLLEHKPPN